MTCTTYTNYRPWLTCLIWKLDLYKAARMVGLDPTAANALQHLDA